MLGSKNTTEEQDPGQDEEKKRVSELLFTA